jgi:hypothetical protein
MTTYDDNKAQRQTYDDNKAQRQIGQTMKL